MLCRVYCACCDGLMVNTITVEVSVSNGIRFFLVGLPDSAIKESQQRVENALNVYGYRIPGKRIVINLAPANIRKEGSGFDAAIAIGILSSSRQIYLEEKPNIESEQSIEPMSIEPKLQQALDENLIIGELALDGSLRGVSGALPIINHAKKEGFRGVILPESSAHEGEDIDGINIYKAANIKEVIEILKSNEFAQSKRVIPQDKKQENSLNYEYDFGEVKGQTFAKKGLEIAAAGGHNVIMVGSPGSGKTFMAKCLPSILPPMTKEESVETSEIYSIANLLKGGLIKARPFRAPHHTITIAALVGGGNRCTPGEISLSHNGVLFADEFAEFDHKVVEVLRQPLENGTIEISRVRNKYIYPASFMFVGAMNPCPCGYLFDDNSKCRCSSSQISKYQSKISGPILDRIDIYLKIKQLPLKDIQVASTQESSAKIAERVLRAREIQYRRYKNESFIINSQISQSKLSTFCRLGAKEEEYLKKIVEVLNISMRSYTRILKIARTIADLNGEQDIKKEHIGMAIQLRYPEP